MDPGKESIERTPGEISPFVFPVHWKRFQDKIGVHQTKKPGHTFRASVLTREKAAGSRHNRPAGQSLQPLHLPQPDRVIWRLSTLPLQELLR